MPPIKRLPETENGLPLLPGTAACKYIDKIACKAAEKPLYYNQLIS